MLDGEPLEGAAIKAAATSLSSRGGARQVCDAAYAAIRAYCAKSALGTSIQSWRSAGVVVPAGSGDRAPTALRITYFYLIEQIATTSLQ